MFILYMYLNLKKIEHGCHCIGHEVSRYNLEKLCYQNRYDFTTVNLLEINYYSVVDLLTILKQIFQNSQFFFKKCFLVTSIRSEQKINDYMDIVATIARLKKFTI